MILPVVAFAAGCGPPEAPGVDAPGMDAGPDTDGSKTECTTRSDAGCACNYQGKQEGVCATATIDPATGACAEPVSWSSTESNCSDGLDNDCDGTADCMDPDCAAKTCGQGQGAVCVSNSCRERTCSDGIDNDGDGKTDCADSDCLGKTCEAGTERTCPQAWQSEETKCDGIDNDCDGNTDVGCECVYDPGEPDSRDTNASHDSGVCTGEALTKSGSCSQPTNFERRTDSESSCDADDNDCDGVVDEGCPCTYDPSESDSVDTDGDNDHGVCTNQSRDSHGTCEKPRHFASSETCGDRYDNDCDGILDDWDETTCRSFQMLQSSNEDKLNAVASDSSGNMVVAGSTQGTFGSNTSAGNSDVLLAKYGPSGRRKWVTLFGSGDDDLATGVAVGPGGSIYVAGETRGALPGNSHAGYDDGFVAEFTPTGTRNWIEQFGSSGYDAANDVAVDSNGDIFVAGAAGGAVGGASHSGSDDILVARYDSSGNRKWVELSGGSGGDNAQGIAVDSNGNVLIAGKTSTSLGSNQNAGFSDAFVSKYSPNGTRNWVELIGGSSNETARGVTTIPPVGTTYGDTIYVAGSTDSDLGSKTNNGGGDAFLVKFSASGYRSWTRLFGSSATETTFDVASEGFDLYVGGETKGSFGGESNSGDYDGFVARYGNLGSRNWVRYFGTSSWDRLYGLASSPSNGGSIYAAGSTQGAFSHFSPDGNFDGFLVRLK